MNLGLHAFTRGNSPAASSLLQEADQLAGQAIVSTRRIVNDLRPQMLEDLGLFAALDMLADQFSQRHGVACWVALSEGMDDGLLLAPDLATCLYRVTQEALNNVAKHAQANEVEIRLQALPEAHIGLSVRDDGRGMAADNGRKSESYGLLGIRERVRAHGGTLRVGGSPDGGTLLEVNVPLTRPAERAAPPGLPPRPTVGPLTEAGGSMTVGAVISPAVEIEETQALARLLSRSAALAMQSTIDALDGNVAVLDPHGTIRFVNRAWERFAQLNGRRPGRELPRCVPQRRPQRCLGDAGPAGPDRGDRGHAGGLHLRLPLPLAAAGALVQDARRTHVQRRHPGHALRVGVSQAPGAAGDAA